MYKKTVYMMKEVIEIFKWYKSKHSLDEVVDKVLSVSPISSSLEGMPLLGESSSGTSQFEGPQEVVGLLKVGTNGIDLVDQVLYWGDVELAQSWLNNSVVGQRNSLVVHLSVSSLQNQFSNGFSRRVTKNKCKSTRRWYRAQLFSKGWR